MSLAFSTNAFKRTSFEDAIRLIAAIGYTGVEFMCDLHHALPARMTPGRIKDIQHLLQDLDLTVSNLNAFTGFACSGPNEGGIGDTYHPTWIEHDPKLRQARIDHTQRCIDLAAAFNCRTVSLQPAGPLIGTGLTPAQASERFAEGLSQCLPSATSANVLLAIEPEPGLLLQHASEYLTFKRTHFPNHPHLKMNCDTGHLFCVGDDPAQIILDHPDEIAHIHLEDIGANQVHQHLTPGNGAMNFPAIFAALRTIQYTGKMTVELYPYDSSPTGVAKAALTHLAPMLS